jgi:mycothiol synthase
MEPTSLTLARCDPAAEKDVLALAAQAWPEAERAGYWQAIGALLRSDQAERVVLISARAGDQLLAAQLGQTLSGRAAVVWPPCFSSDKSQLPDDDLVTSLFAHLFRGLIATGAQLAQALLSPDDQVSAALFSRGGFARAADLLYLAAEIQTAPQDLAPLPFELAPFQLGDESRLVALIERTYLGTLDCPSIDGLRNTADVVAGYQAVGDFHPELWSLVRSGGDDVGCLLVNLHPDVRHAEIVYLALVPEVRGRGWGLALARLAQSLARRADSLRVVLAVDAANRPAIQLYEQAGFVVFDRRAVWIKSLKELPKS